MSLVEVVVGTLAVWRVSHLLQAEDGPRGAMAGLRRAAGEGILGGLLDCFYCVSIWVAVPAALLLGTGWPERAMLWLGLSGGACLLERATAPAARFVEDEPGEGSDVLLRGREAEGRGDGRSGGA